LDLDLGFGSWDLGFGIWDLGFGIWDFLVPIRGYAKEGDTENVEFVGIAA
jgi:hypothetical protein